MSADPPRRPRRDRRDAVARRPAQGGQGGDDRHGRHRLHRHAGAAVRQAHPGGVLPRRRRRARRRGLQLPARARHGDGPDPGLRDGQLGGGLRRLRDRPGHGDAAPDPVARPHGARAVRRREPRRLAGRRLAAPGPDRPVRARRTRWATRRCSPPSSSSTSTRRATPRRTRRTTADLTPTIPYILDYHILATTMDEQYLGADPPRDARRRDPGRVLEGRGLVRAARGQHALRGCGHLGRPAHDLQERRQGDRVPERDLGDLHGEAVREGHRQLLPHPLEPRRRRGGESVFVDGDEETDVFRHYLGGMRARIGSWRCSSPRPSTPTSATRPRAGRRPRSPGAATTAPAAFASSATGSRGGSSAGSPAPTSTRTSATRRCWPPASTASSRAPTRGRS